MNQRQALYVLAHVSGVVSARVEFEKDERGYTKKTLVAVIGDGQGHTTDVLVRHFSADWGRTIVVLLAMRHQWLDRGAMNLHQAERQVERPVLAVAQ